MKKAQIIPTEETVDNIMYYLSNQTVSYTDSLPQEVCMQECEVTSVTSDCVQSCGLRPPGLLCPWHSPGKNTRVGCRALSPGKLPHPGIEPSSLTSPAQAGRFFSSSTLQEGQSYSKLKGRTSLVVQGTRVRFQVWEDSACWGATEPVGHSLWVQAQQLPEPTRLQPELHSKRSRSQEGLAAIREGLSKATKTRCSQKQAKKLKGNLIPVLDTLDSHFYFNMEKRILNAINVSLVMVGDQIKSICPLTPKFETSYFLLWYFQFEFFCAMAWLPFTFEKLVNDQEHF